MGNTAGALAGKKRFLSIRNRPFGFNAIHDPYMSVSEDNQTAHWGLRQGHTEGEGRCYSNRTLRVNEVIRLSVRGSGFFDLGLTDVHPAQLHNNKDFTFKYVVSKVLYFDPIELRLRIGSDGSVYLTDGKDPEVKLSMGAKASSHWLAMRLGCGEVTVSFLRDEDASTGQSSSDSDDVRL